MNRRVKILTPEPKSSLLETALLALTLIKPPITSVEFTYNGVRYSVEHTETTDEVVSKFEAISKELIPAIKPIKKEASSVKKEESHTVTGNGFVTGLITGFIAENL